MSAIKAMPPVAATQISDAWIAMVAEIARRDGHALRAGVGHTIEAQQINEPHAWGQLMLEHSGFTFTTAEDRDVVLAKIQRAAAKG